MSTGAVFAGLGAGVDLAKAFAARQRLSEVATLACQYSTRPSVAQTANASYAGTNGFQTYVNAVNAYATASLATQQWAGATPTGGTATPTSYFTATPAVGGTTAVAAEPTNSGRGDQRLGSHLLRQDPQPHEDPDPRQDRPARRWPSPRQIVNPPTVLKEGFETPCSNFCATNPFGGSTFISTPTSTFPATAGYVGYKRLQVVHYGLLP